MKLLCPLLTFTLLLACNADSLAAESKKKNKVKAPETPTAAVADVMARFDKNQNGILDTPERAAVRAAFAAEASLKSLDLNADGKLDEGELDKAEGVTKKAGKGKKK